MHALIHSLVKETPVILDGAWGTALGHLGLQPGSPPEEWNRDHPDRVLQVAQSYVEAGSRIILTNSFGGSPIRLNEFGLGDQAHRLNMAAARISKQACHLGKTLVFGSIGPCGKMVLMGEVIAEEVANGFNLQAEALAEGGVDGLVVETMADPKEAALAIQAAAKTGLPVVSCFVFDSGPDRCKTMMGLSVADAFTIARDNGTNVFGANCGLGIDQYLPLTKRMVVESGDLPVWIKANAGMPRIQDGQPRWPIDAVSFRQHASTIIQAGATFIGGCCGTDPETVRQLNRLKRAEFQ